VHGEPRAQQALASALRAQHGMDARIPQQGESLRL
jgi:predicted metal-dependent RNase